MKKVMLILLCSLAFVCGGCDKEEVQALADQTEQLNASVEKYQALTNELIGTLDDYALVPAGVIEKVEKASEEIDRVQPQVAAIVAAIQQAQYGDDDWQNLVAGLQAANVASAPFNPYAAPVSASLALLSAVLTIFARNKAKEAARNAAKYQAHKQGVEGALISESNEVKEKVYKGIGDARANLGVK